MAAFGRYTFKGAARKVAALAAESHMSVDQALRVIGEEILTDVKASGPGRGVPVDEGTLRSTGRVRGPEQGKVTISFGGPAAPYAVVQHERIDFHHAIGEARYLVRGLERWRVENSGLNETLRGHWKGAIRVASKA